MNQEKLVTSLNHYLSLLLTTSALFIAPCIIIIFREIPTDSEPYPGFFTFLYMALYLNVLSFLATIIVGLLSMKNLDYINIIEIEPTQDMLYKTAKLYNTSRLFYRISVYSFLAIFPSFVATKINLLLNSTIHGFLLTYLVITPFVITVLILMKKYSLKENMLTIKQLWSEPQ